MRGFDSCYPCIFTRSAIFFKKHYFRKNRKTTLKRISKSLSPATYFLRRRKPQIQHQFTHKSKLQSKFQPKLQPNQRPRGGAQVFKPSLINSLRHRILSLMVSLSIRDFDHVFMQHEPTNPVTGLPPLSRLTQRLRRSGADLIFPKQSTLLSVSTTNFPYDSVKNVFSGPRTIFDATNYYPVESLILTERYRRRKIVELPKVYWKHKQRKRANLPKLLKSRFKSVYFNLTPLLKKDYQAPYLSQYLSRQYNLFVSWKSTVSFGGSNIWFTKTLYPFYTFYNPRIGITRQEKPTNRQLTNHLRRLSKWQKINVLVVLVVARIRKVQFRRGVRSYKKLVPPFFSAKNIRRFFYKQRGLFYRNKRTKRKRLRRVKRFFKNFYWKRLGKWKRRRLAQLFTPMSDMKYYVKPRMYQGYKSSLIKQHASPTNLPLYTDLVDLPGLSRPLALTNLAVLFLLKNPFFYKTYTRSTFSTDGGLCWANRSLWAFVKRNTCVGLPVTNIYPSESFSFMFTRKILNLAVNSIFKLDVTPWYHTNIVRFIEFAVGRKVLLQFYPFMAQEVKEESMLRYRLWLPRMAYYERRLGHRFFLEEALHIFHLGFLLRDASIIGSWLRSMIIRISFWKTRLIFRFLKYLFTTYFTHIFKDLGMQGIKIRLKGKISASGNSRTRTIHYRAGVTSHSTVDVRVLHERYTINTFTGVLGLQFWLFY